MSELEIRKACFRAMRNIEDSAVFMDIEGWSDADKEIGKRILRVHNCYILMTSPDGSRWLIDFDCDF